MHSSNHIIKFAEDTTVVGLIRKNDESAYRGEVQRLTAWCKANNLSLNVEKTKEKVVDFRRAQSDHSPLDIDRSNMKIVKSTKFLGVHLAEVLTWSLKTSSITRTAQQRQAHLPPLILTTLYRGTIESILSSCITAWFGNCTMSDRKTLQRIVRTAEIIGVSLPYIMDIYSTRCICKVNSIVDDPTHTLFTLLSSGKRTMANRGGQLRCQHRWLYNALCAVLEPCTNGFVYTFQCFQCAACFKLLVDLEEQDGIEHLWLAPDHVQPICWHSYSLIEDTCPVSHLLTYVTMMFSNGTWIDHKWETDYQLSNRLPCRVHSYRLHRAISMAQAYGHKRHAYLISCHIQQQTVLQYVYFWEYPIWTSYVFHL
ncbi:hypothetical protein QTP70_003159 [Hemibagrus guttatus]|uniref:Alkylated DNA repair protein AlkB homologue 8 N-terminal domain-containing protein n=1 Tax=Hemibagrus guttatus TaxID=175788 RepID=A0AAE0QJ80_9TELE|nr:hypothetical protein QTP70_003159 [Hemibagrus guttatus]